MSNEPDTEPTQHEFTEVQGERLALQRGENINSDSASQPTNVDTINVSPAVGNDESGSLPLVGLLSGRTYIESTRIQSIIRPPSVRW